jgi:hypothetical protein
MEANSGSLRESVLPGRTGMDVRAYIAFSLFRLLPVFA